MYLQGVFIIPKQGKAVMCLYVIMNGSMGFVIRKSINANSVRIQLLHIYPTGIFSAISRGMMNSAVM